MKTIKVCIMLSENHQILAGKCFRRVFFIDLHVQSENGIELGS